MYCCTLYWHRGGVQCIVALCIGTEEAYSVLLHSVLAPRRRAVLLQYVLAPRRGTVYCCSTYWHRGGVQCFDAVRIGFHCNGSDFYYILHCLIIVVTIN